MATLRRKVSLILFQLVTIVFVGISLYPVGKIIIVDGVSTAGKTSICQKLKNCEHLSWDKTIFNLCADVVERKIANLDKDIISQIVQYGIVSEEKTDEGETIYKLPRNNVELLYKKMVILYEKMPSLGIVYEREAYDQNQKCEEEQQIENSFQKKDESVGLLTKFEIHKCVEKVEEAMLEAAVKLAEQGKNVVIDTGIEDAEVMDMYREHLSKYKPCFVLVYCAAKDLVTRVRERNKEAAQSGVSIPGFSLEERKLDQPMMQLLAMYKPGNNQSSNMDHPLTLSKDDLDFVFKIGNDLFAKNCKVEELKQKIIKKFDLENNNFVSIVPQFEHDLVVDNSKKDNLNSCVKQIQSQIDD